MAVPTPRVLRGATVGIVGTGQVGGSLVRRLSRYRTALTVCAFDRDQALAAQVGRFARFCDSLADLVCESDVVVLAVPVHTAIRLLPRIAALAGRRRSARKLIVFDTGTVKERIVAAAARHEAAFDFVGLHPLAGTEGPGWEAANPAMFDGRAVVMCPARPRAVRVARELVALVGGIPVRMDACEHDRLVAEGIGLPHILAFAAAGMGGRALDGAVLKAGSWRSLTRVAASSADMVAGFLHGNRAHQLRVLAAFSRQLDVVARALRHPSVQPLERRLEAWQRVVRTRKKA
jgi:prephenate dehydrogenase